MGFRLRKSFTYGSTRLTVSKSGVSYSVGCKGFRTTKKANEKVSTTISIPKTGISYISAEESLKQKSTSSFAVKLECIKWWIILAVVIVIGVIMLCTYCQSVQHNKWIEEERAKHNYSIDFCYIETPTLTQEYNNKGNCRAIFSGKLKNQSGYDCAGATFIFGFYNENNQLLGTAKKVILDFENNTKRDFKVYTIYYDEIVATARLINVEYSLLIK